MGTERKTMSHFHWVTGPRDTKAVCVEAFLCYFHWEAICLSHFLSSMASPFLQVSSGPPLRQACLDCWNLPELKFFFCCAISLLCRQERCVSCTTGQPPEDNFSLITWVPANGPWKHCGVQVQRIVITVEKFNQFTKRHSTLWGLCTKSHVNFSHLFRCRCFRLPLRCFISLFKFPRLQFHRRSRTLQLKRFRSFSRSEFQNIEQGPQWTRTWSNKIGLSKQEAPVCGYRVFQEEMLKLCCENLRKIIKHVRSEANFFLISAVILW